MSSLGNDQNRPYWRSLEELEADPAAAEALTEEFPANADELTDPLSRRNFVQLMGASLAFAGVAGAGCRRWEKEKIEPLSRRPDDYIPGVPKKYATAMPINGAAESVVVTSFEGRPIKVDGNPDHPLSGTGSSTFAQASVLNLYDPDRSRSVRRGDTASTWQEFESELKTTFKNAAANGGKGIAVLSEAVLSPSLAMLKEGISDLPEAKWYEWEPLTRDNERAGTKAAFGGQAAHARANLDKANVIIALDCDLLVEHPAALAHSKGFAARRRPTPSNPDMSRLYAIESMFTSTGAVADHRLPIRSELILPFLMAVDAKVNGTQAPAAKFLSDKKVAAFVDTIATELNANKGAACVMVGHNQPAEVHALAARLNFDVGAISANPQEEGVVVYLNDLDAARESHAEAIKACVNDMNAGSIETLIILGGNPAYNAPTDLDFGGALSKVKTSIHLSAYDDETSEKCTWHLPRAHYLESWGDHLTYDGSYTLQQPIVEPLHGGKSELDVLVMLIPRKGGLTVVRESFNLIAGRIFRDTEKAWRQTLHDGFINGVHFSAPSQVTSRPSFDNPTLTAGQLGELAGGNTVEVVFTRSPHAYDGRFANNAWLQETPDFMTKLTWDNAALIGPRTASDLGISHGDKVTVSAGGRTLEMAAFVMAGQAPNSIAVSLGHGRTRVGRVGGMSYNDTDGSGFDTYKLRGSEGLYIVPGGTIAKSGGKYMLASTVDHWQMDAMGRKGIDQRLPQLVREGTLEEYKKEPNFANHGKHAPHYWQHGSLWKEHEYNGYKWGMAIDLNTCTGCNSCMVACQAENNIPVVGKDQVARSREMHWLRIDRYFKGDKNDPEVVHQPVTCMQCENAPCEQVCPVGATVHSSEGLNDMVYNRCVGTRYCLNNCPYRVRRFNFLDWHNNLGKPENKVRKLLFNPEVTVRSRGVMEKCTFCVQRIRAVTIPLRNSEVKDGAPPELADGAITTACEEACPTNAIVFGDLNNPKHRVAQQSDEKQTPRNYKMLAEYQNKPRTVFLARIRNPNPQLVARLKA
jgi:molybdopterin-containing oxidoreductase family iron-sulfur binding subunit